MRNKVFAATMALLAVTSVPTAARVVEGLSSGDKLSVALFEGGVRTILAINEQPLLAPTAPMATAAVGAGGILYAVFDRDKPAPQS